MFKRSAIACVLLASFPGLAFSQGLGKTAPRTVQLGTPAPSDLIKIVKVTVGGVEITPGLPFAADDSWFNRLRIGIRNESAKEIVFVAGQLSFPETGDAEHLAIMDRILIGRRPEHAQGATPAGRGFNDAPSPPILVGRGQEISVPVADSFEAFKTAIEKRQSLSSVRTCVVGITTLYFDDGTEWLSGLYFRADPNTPGRYVRISPDQFRQEASQ